MSEEIRFVRMESPVGSLGLAESAKGLVAIQFHMNEGDPSWEEVGSLQCDAVEQLNAYFKGRLREFDLPLDPCGTPFQMSVWNALLEIPYGETISYGDLAACIGRPDASRAVGAANGKNPLPIVIPCHRVIGSNGSLTGYGGGLEIKRALLAMERVGTLPLFATETGRLPS